jgi:xylulokinase
MTQYLGIDVGTQGVKALVYDADAGRVVGRGAVPLELLEIGREGAAEQHPEDWLRATDTAVREALGGEDVRREALAGIGVSGQQHGFVALDGKEQVLRPAKLWCDTETAPEAAELSRTLGRPLPAGWTASKILWLKRHEPDSFARLRHVLLPHDYVNLWLTGRRAMEAGDASGTGLMAAPTRSWDGTALRAIDAGLAAMLPELVRHDSWLGALKAERATAWGLPDGIPVAPGSGDNMMSALGAGAVREGVVVCSLGTSGTLFGRSDTPLEDHEGLVAPFCDALGGWLPLLCTMNCTTVVEEVRAGFGLDHDAAAALAAEVPPGCDGLLFLPYLNGERAPDWPHARGVLHGLGTGDLRAERLYRAAMEGATLALLAGWRRMQALGLRAEELRVVGGGSKSALWRRILADAFGLPLRFPAEPESAALGGALQAWALDAGDGDPATFLAAHPVPLGDSVVEPDSSVAPVYKEAAERFDALGRSLYAD